MARDVVIVGAARTPIGAFQGALAALSAPQLGAVAIKAALARAGLKPAQVDQVYMGHVLQAGVGQAPARQALRLAGLGDEVPAVTIHKVCGSGMQAIVNGAQVIALGDADVVIAGGMESMSNAPYLSMQLRSGARLGHVEFKDSIVHDGLTDAYDNVHMGLCAEATAAEMNISRAAQDAFAAESTNRAVRAQKEGLFKNEIVPVAVPQKKGEPILVSEDEGPKNAKVEKIPSLKPVFKAGGTVTAANASSINDGAAAVVLMSAEKARALGLPVVAKVAGYAVAARKPTEFTIAPADAINKLLAKTGKTIGEVDVWEINEAFAVVSLANNQLLGLDHAQVNLRGGAVVLGHPIGASGARVLVTLLSIMADHQFKRGVASLCIGGGEGIALMSSAKYATGGDFSMNKLVASADEAVADLFDGCTLMSGGFGLCGNPENLIAAVLKKNVKQLTIIANNCGTTELGLGVLLKNKQVKRMVSSYVGENKEFERQFLSGELEVELTPQGTLAERIRAGGAGIGGFFVRTGVGTEVAKGKEVRVIDGHEHVLELPLKADFAIIRAWKADAWGNLVFNKTARNFSPMMCAAAKVTIVEAEQLVPVGAIDPDHVHVPGVYVQRVIQSTNLQKWVERRTVQKRA